MLVDSSTFFTRNFYLKINFIFLQVPKKCKNVLFLPPWLKFEVSNDKPTKGHAQILISPRQSTESKEP